LCHDGWQPARARGRGSADHQYLLDPRQGRAPAYSDLGVLREWAGLSRLLGVGDASAQQQAIACGASAGRLRVRDPQPALGAVDGRAAGGGSARTQETSARERFDLPDRHPDLAPATPGRAYLTVMEGCDLFCSFCIVPLTRGREISRPASAILREAALLAAAGVREVTLLGRTVNAYSRHDLRRAAPRNLGFAACSEVAETRASRASATRAPILPSSMTR
jgi:hypothetical protein